MDLQWIKSTDWPTFWTALEAIATSLAFLALTYEVISSRRENVRHKWEGFKYANEILMAEDMLNAIEKFPKMLNSAEFLKDPQEFRLNAWVILRRIEIVAHLVTEKYVKKDLLFRMYGPQFSAMYKALSIMWDVDTTLIPKLVEERKQFPNAVGLLHDADDWTINVLGIDVFKERAKQA